MFDWVPNAPLNSQLETHTLVESQLTTRKLLNLSSNRNEVIRAVLFFFFHNKISQAQNRLQQTMIKKNTHKKHLREKKLLICLFAFCGSILLVLLVKTKSLNGLKKLVFMSLPVPLN